MRCSSSTSLGEERRIFRWSGVDGDMIMSVTSQKIGAIMLREGNRVNRRPYVRLPRERQAKWRVV
jgi:hypothetical protein